MKMVRFKVNSMTIWMLGYLNIILTANLEYIRPVDGEYFDSLKSTDIIQSVVFDDGISYNLITFGVNGQELQNMGSWLSDPPIPSPNSHFPFSRMATATHVYSNTTYIYHQINSSFLGQEVWNCKAAEWSSNAIPIKVS